MRLGRLIVVVVCMLTAGLETPAGEKGEALFNGKDLKGWTFRGGEKKAGKSKWSVVDGVALESGNLGRFLTKEGSGAVKAGTGVLLNGDDGRGVDLLTEMKHGDCELYVEFNVAKGSNSGIYFHGQYEVQILDSFGKAAKDLKYGDCGGIYNHSAPRVNASKSPGNVLQTFNVVFQAPRFDDKGKKTANAKFLKVTLNDVVVQENVEVKGPTNAALGGAERATGPLMLQGDHGPVAFRALRITHKK